MNKSYGYFYLESVINNIVEGADLFALDIYDRKFYYKKFLNFDECNYKNCFLWTLCPKKRFSFTNAKQVCLVRRLKQNELVIPLDMNNASTNPNNYEFYVSYVVENKLCVSQSDKMKFYAMSNIPSASAKILDIVFASWYSIGIIRLIKGTLIRAPQCSLIDECKLLNIKLEKPNICHYLIIKEDHHWICPATEIDNQGLYARICFYQKENEPKFKLLKELVVT